MPPIIDTITAFVIWSCRTRVWKWNPTSLHAKKGPTCFFSLCSAVVSLKWSWSIKNRIFCSGWQCFSWSNTVWRTKSAEMNQVRIIMSKTKNYARVQESAKKHSNVCVPLFRFLETIRLVVVIHISTHFSNNNRNASNFFPFNKWNCPRSAVLQISIYQFSLKLEDKSRSKNCLLKFTYEILGRLIGNVT